jgi:hypothetical protein
MLKISKLQIGLAVLILFSFTVLPREFSGRIVYRHSFVSLQGDDIAAKLASYMGSGMSTYITSGNYIIYNDKKQIAQLYTRVTNQYQVFNDGKLVSTRDAAIPMWNDVIVTPLTETITVLGYRCKAIQMVTNGVRTVYYYAPDLKVNPESYSKHALGDWYTYMKATDGSLTLKYVITSPKDGYVATSEAISVEAMPLSAADFLSTSAAR